MLKYINNGDFSKKTSYICGKINLSDKSDNSD